MVVTRLIKAFEWNECERLMAIFLKKWIKPTLRPLQSLSAVAFLESVNEVKPFVKIGNQIIVPLEVVFRAWQPWMNSICHSSLNVPRWVSIRGLPIHLWSPGMMKAIGELCGGFVRLSCTLDDTEVYCKLKIQVKEGALGRIPRVVMVEDQGYKYPVQIFVVDSAAPPAGNGGL